MSPVVTALRERPRGRVEIHLDGTPWRLVPADVVVRAGLRVGRDLDRTAARALARELRRARAIRTAVRALGHRDLSRRDLEARLAARGTGAAARTEALETLERVGLLDDARAARARARSLAGRGYGDAAVRDALERDGFVGEQVAEALAALEPERERARARLEGGGGAAKALRRLAARGFDPETVEDLARFADTP